MSKIDFEGVELTALSQDRDRDKWRVVVKAVMTTRVL
jgi:hypothetical protein